MTSPTRSSTADLRLSYRTKERDLLAEMTVATHVTALTNLLQQTRSGEPRIAIERAREGTE